MYIKSSGWNIKFDDKACEVLKTKEFTVVNDCFQNEHNEKIGHYRQTLNNEILIIKHNEEK